MKIFHRVVFIFLTFTTVCLAEGPMTGAGLRDVIETITDKSESNGNIIEFSIKGSALACIYDERHNRMRIIAPIGDFAEVTEAQKDRMLEANFHSALDARYSVSNGILYAAYIHPLASLSDRDVITAIYQVISLQQTFGKEYSSGLLTFGGDNDTASEEI